MFLLAFLPILIILIIIAYLVYMGAFLPLGLEEKEVGPFHFLYKEVNGKDFGLVGKTTSEIAELLKQYNFSNQRPLQVFFPDEDKRPAEVGFVVNEKTNDLQNIKFKTIPTTLCITTSFPWRNSFSFILGFMKVDPALRNYRNSKQYKKTEAMVILENETIVYMQPIQK